MLKEILFCIACFLLGVVLRHSIAIDETKQLKTVISNNQKELDERLCPKFYFLITSYNSEVDFATLSIYKVGNGIPIGNISMPIKHEEQYYYPIGTEFQLIKLKK